PPRPTSGSPRLQWSRSRRLPSPANGGCGAQTPGLRASAASPGSMPSLRLASYNIHCGIGRDGRFSEQRILDVLREIDADVVALQEVESLKSGIDMLGWLARATASHAVAGTTRTHDDGHYGNGILTRCPIVSTELLDLSWRGREPRGAIAADID